MRQVQVRGKRLAFSVRPEGIAQSFGDLILSDDDQERSVSVSLHDYDPWPVVPGDMDHEPALDNARFERGRSLQHSADVDLRHAALFMRNSAWGVNESSQLHHDGNAGLAAIDNVG